MMLSGCYGLLRAFAVHFPWSSADIGARLDFRGAETGDVLSFGK
jgi:hypothetical protein